MESKISYYEYRERGGTQVDVNIDARTPDELDILLLELRGAKVAPPPGSPELGVEPPTLVPTTREPYIDIGDGQGKAGDTVEIPVIGGCRYLVNGFHIGGGVGKTDEDRSGYSKFEAVGIKLGSFLQDYLDSKGMGESYWADFEMVKWLPHGALPEEWWQYAMAFFSIKDARGPIMPIQIPAETLLFTLRIKILETTAPGEYELTCKDEHHYTQSRQRRRDWVFTTNRDSPLARGGVTKIDCLGGKLTVVA